MISSGRPALRKRCTCLARRPRRPRSRGWRACAARGGRWRTRAGAPSPSCRAPHSASAPTRRSRDRPAGARGSSPSRIGKSARTRCEDRSSLPDRQPPLRSTAVSSASCSASSSIGSVSFGEESAHQHRSPPRPAECRGSSGRTATARRARRRSSRGRRRRRRRKSRARASRRSRASSESISPCIISLASVFCASRLTMILPWNTALLRPRAICL